MTPQQKPTYSNLQFAKDLWFFFGRYKWKFIFFTTLLVIVALLGLVPSIILAKIIDFFSSDYSSLRQFYILLGILLGVGIFSTIARLRSKYHLGLFTNELRKDLKVETFQKMMQGDLVWHDKENTGNKMQMIIEGDNSIDKFMKFYSNDGINLVVSIIGILAVFAYFSLKYAFLALAFMVVYLIVEFNFNKKIAGKTLSVKIAQEGATGRSFEFSSNISTVKSLGIESSLNSQIDKQETEVLEKKNQKRKINNLKWISIQLIATLFYSLFILLVGKDVVAGALTIGSIVIYVNYVTKLQSTLNVISNQADNLIDIKYSVFRMMKIYNTVPEINEEGAKRLVDWGEIKIKDLQFKYKDEGVLDNFNFTIKKGEKIGVVGKSGCGKSTLFKLLLKLYLPQKGMIYFDRKPITGIKRNSLINKISIVPQETEVFNSSLRENITITGNGRVNLERYKTAIIASQLSSVIKKLKDKDLSLIGEKGVRLSGGEKQRLGIARAIYKDSEIIIFDEATSNLDYQTENEIQKALDKLKGKTILISAHRLSTLKNMDKIIVMEKGKIIEEGTYNTLLKNRGKFYKLWKEQGAWKD